MHPFTTLLWLACVAVVIAGFGAIYEAAGLVPTIILGVVVWLAGSWVYTRFDRPRS